MELIKIDNNLAILDEQIVKNLIFLEKQAKEIKEAQENYKNAILKEMEERNIIKIENDDVLINYIAPTDRETLDGKSLRQDHPQLYDAYIKMTPVKSTIRIKVKEKTEAEEKLNAIKDIIK